MLLLSVSGERVIKVNSTRVQHYWELVTTSPYSYTWNDVNVGRYSLTAQATDSNGGVGISTEVNVAVVNGDATGFILREWWTGITTGAAVSNLTSDINYPTNPNGRALLPHSKGPATGGSITEHVFAGAVSASGQRNYTFWISSDDAGTLRLSTDDDPCHAVQIAYVANWTNSREWNKESNQQSSPKPLLAGHKYYIEALQKEAGGGDYANIAVAWQGPSITQQVIDGVFILPVLIHRLLNHLLAMS